MDKKRRLGLAVLVAKETGGRQRADEQGCGGSNSAKNNLQVLPRFELGLEESEPSVITNYTNGPLLHALFHVTI